MNGVAVSLISSGVIVITATSLACRRLFAEVFSPAMLVPVGVPAVSRA
jgi:hypothetical protein